MIRAWSSWADTHGSNDLMLAPLPGLKVSAVAIVAHTLWDMARNPCPDQRRTGIALAALLTVVLVSGPQGQVATASARSQSRSAHDRWPWAGRLPSGRHWHCTVQAANRDSGANGRCAARNASSGPEDSVTGLLYLVYGQDLFVRLELLQTDHVGGLALQPVEKYR